MDTSITLIPAALVLPVVGWLVFELRKAQGKTAEWQERWAKEVQRNARLYNSSPSVGQPERPPDPEWDEPSKVQDMRAVATKQGMDVELERYLDSTPPGVPHPKR